LLLDSASPPSLSAIAKVEGLTKQTVFRLKQDPQAALAALEAWGCDGCANVASVASVLRRRFFEPLLRPSQSERYRTRFEDAD
jgi:hypothetical protein